MNRNKQISVTRVSALLMLICWIGVGTLLSQTITIFNPPDIWNSNLTLLWEVGTSKNIEWNTQWNYLPWPLGCDYSGVTIELSTDGWASWSDIAPGNFFLPGSNTYSWYIDPAMFPNPPYTAYILIEGACLTAACSHAFRIYFPWQPPTIIPGTWNDVSFGDASTGWAVGTNSTNGIATNYTTSGGWGAPLTLAISPSSPPVTEWTGVSFVDANNGWIVGTEGTNCYIIKTNDGGGSWSFLPSPGDPTKTISGFVPKGIAFSDLSYGWVVGSGSLYNIYYTIDGGGTWLGASTPPGVSSLMGVTALRNPMWTWAFAVGSNGPDGIVIRALDGVNWETVANATSVPALSTHPLYDIALTDTAYLWAVGQAGTILASASAGWTWNVQSSPTSSDLFGVAFRDHTHGWAVGAGGTMLEYKPIMLSSRSLREPNAHSGPWQSITSGTTSDLKTIAMSGGRVGCAMGALGTVLNYESYGPDSIEATTTYARRWNMVSVPLTVSDFRKTVLYHPAVSVAYAYQGTYVQKDTLANDVAYWLKFNEAQSILMRGSLRSLDTVSVSRGWNMIGSISNPVPTATIASIPGGLVTSPFYGYENRYVVKDSIMPGKGYWVKVSDNGRLILTSFSLPEASARIKVIPTDELPPAAPEGEEQAEAIVVPTHYALEQSYPNPFNPTTVIRYQLPVNSYVKLTVYNILGEEIKTLVDGLQEAGFKSVEFDATSLPSGVYFYRLSAGNALFVKKMLLAR